MLQLTIWEYMRNTPSAKRPSLFHTIAPWIQYNEITWNYELTKLLIQRQWSFSTASWWRCLTFGNCILDSIIGQSENEIDSFNYTESWSLESKWPSYCFSCSFAFSVSPGTKKLWIVAFLGKFHAGATIEWLWHCEDGHLSNWLKSGRSHTQDFRLNQPMP